MLVCHLFTFNVQTWMVLKASKDLNDKPEESGFSVFKHCFGYRVYSISIGEARRTSKLARQVGKLLTRIDFHRTSKDKGKRTMRDDIKLAERRRILESVLCEVQTSYEQLKDEKISKMTSKLYHQNIIKLMTYYMGKCATTWNYDIFYLLESAMTKNYNSYTKWFSSASISWVYTDTPPPTYDVSHPYGPNKHECVQAEMFVKHLWSFAIRSSFYHISLQAVEPYMTEMSSSIADVWKDVKIATRNCVYLPAWLCRQRHLVGKYNKLPDTTPKSGTELNYMAKIGLNLPLYADNASLPEKRLRFRNCRRMSEMTLTYVSWFDILLLLWSSKRLV